MNNDLDSECVELKALCERMLRVLNDPHPGLLSWNSFRVQAAKDLQDWLNDKLVDVKVKP